MVNLVANFFKKAGIFGKILICLALIFLSGFSLSYSVIFMCLSNSYWNMAGLTLAILTVVFAVLCIWRFVGDWVDEAKDI